MIKPSEFTKLLATFCFSAYSALYSWVTVPMSLPQSSPVKKKNKGLASETRLRDLTMFTEFLPALQLGHRAYEPGSEAFAKVVEEFGEGILDQEGRVDRKVLGPMVFSDKVQ